MNHTKKNFEIVKKKVYDNIWCAKKKCN
jgi:hypothetical protein